MFEAAIKGLTLGLYLSISVGPVLFSVIKQSLNNGHRGGFIFVAGVSASDITLVLISNMFTELFASISRFKTEIGVVGCVFLVSMGVYYLFLKKVKVDKEGRQMFAFSKRDYARIFLSGYLMNTLNPAVFVFWIYASTAVITHSVNERIMVFVCCLGLVLGTDIFKVMMAGKIRNRLTPHNIRIINRINGFILIAFGIALIWGLIVYGKRI